MQRSKTFDFAMFTDLRHVFSVGNALTVGAFGGGVNIAVTGGQEEATVNDGNAFKVCPYGWFAQSKCLDESAPVVIQLTLPSRTPDPRAIPE